MFENFSQYQGPALYAWNDAQFKRNDFVALAKINQSSKKEDVLKVGRFGLGFLSVFHLTGKHYLVAIVMNVQCNSSIRAHGGVYLFHDWVCIGYIMSCRSLRDLHYRGPAAQSSINDVETEPSDVTGLYHGY